jgi:FAD/FMN-containing dehydrogenase
MFNARVPDRFPDVIVQANDVYDVVAAVRRARREKLRLTAVSGGHSWAGNHLRDGGLLLDLARLDEVTVDRGAMRATTGPGRSGHELATMLAKHDLFFPAGHCKGVCVGGYLLQGGYGWHGRALGPACMSVVGIDLVTIDGDVVHASETENADLFWAARGAGPGFFAVVTRFHLRVYPRPRTIGFAAQSFAIRHLDEVFRWAHGIRHEVPASIELQLLMSRDTPGVRGGAGITVFAPFFTDGVRAALRDVRFVNKSRVEKHASRKLPFVPSGLGLMYRGVMQHYPQNHRYAVDNMWTGADIDALLPGLQRIADTLPDAPSHVLWMNWAPPKTRPEMAYSMEDDIYLALYSVWKDAKDDARFASWPIDNLRTMQHLSSGCQLADENLGQRPQRFMTDANLARLDRVRAERDPEGVFQPWMGRP